MFSIQFLILPLLVGISCWAASTSESFRLHPSGGSNNHRRYDLEEYTDAVENSIDQTVHQQVPPFLRRWQHTILRKFPSMPDRPNVFHSSSAILPPHKPSEAREALFRGTERSRIVPLNASALMPDRCLLHPFVQTVSHEGCDNVTVKNHLCYGLCSSLFVPTDEAEPITTCTKCAPSDFQSVAVDLNCPGQDRMRKYVRIVRACSCIACTTKDFNG